MLVNQKYKLDGSLISGMRGVGVALIYSPASLFVPFPKSHLFWWLIVAEGLLSAFFFVAALFGGGEIRGGGDFANQYAGCAFRAGVLVDYRLRGVRRSRENSVGSFGDFGVCRGDMFFIQKDVGGRRRERRADVVFAAGCRGARRHDDSPNGAGMLAARLRTHHVLAGGISMAVVSSLTIFTGNLASLYVPDPAYLSALTLTSPLWIMLYNACFGIRDVVEKRWVVAMLLSLCALMFFAQMPLSSPSEIPAAAGHRG